MTLRERESRFAVSFSTMPAHVADLPRFLAAIETWERRPHRIFLTLSATYVRTRETLTPSDLPEEVLKNDRVEILWRDDLGPINKVFWTLRERRADYDWILSLDDDRVYPPTLAGELLSAARRLEAAAVGARGRTFRIGRKYRDTELFSNFGPAGTRFAAPAKVDILTGTGGIVYSASVFAEDFFDTYLERLPACPFLRLTDDVYISGYLASKGLARWVVPHSGAISADAPRPGSLWLVNRDGPYNDQSIEFWARSW